MTMSHILLVDDEPAIRESLVFALERDGFETREAGSLREARTHLDGAQLLVLDLMLPDGNGLDLLAELRRADSPAVIVLTSRDEEPDRVVGLELGADDYVVKPFSPREVVARVRAVLRRTRVPGPDTDEQRLRGPAGITLTPSTRRVCAAGAEIDLSRTEFDLLAVFLRRPGRVYTRFELLDRVWGDAVVGERTVDQHLKGLRRKLAEAGVDAPVIETVRGVGYRLAGSGG